MFGDPTRTWCKFWTVKCSNFLSSSFPPSQRRETLLKHCVGQLHHIKIRTQNIFNAPPSLPPPSRSNLQSGGRLTESLNLFNTRYVKSPMKIWWKQMITLPQITATELSTTRKNALDGLFYLNKCLIHFACWCFVNAILQKLEIIVHQIGVPRFAQQSLIPRCLDLKPYTHITHLVRHS